MSGGVSIEYRPGRQRNWAGLLPAPWVVVRDGRVIARYYSRAMAEWSAQLNQGEGVNEHETRQRS